MSTEIIGMFGAITGGAQDALATIDVPQDSTLVGIDWDLSAIMDAEENVDCELSFIGTSQFSTNDVRGRISSIAARTAVITAVGLTVVSIQKWMSNFEITLAGGERIHLHVLSAASLQGSVRCGLFLDMTSSIRRSARRR